MSDPSLLVTRPTATDPALAPAGRDLLFVLAPCPNLERGPIDWPRVGPAYRDELLARAGGPRPRARRASRARSRCRGW